MASSFLRAHELEPRCVDAAETVTALPLSSPERFGLGLAREQRERPGSRGMQCSMINWRVFSRPRQLCNYRAESLLVLSVRVLFRALQKRTNGPCCPDPVLLARVACAAHSTFKLKES